MNTSNVQRPNVPSLLARVVLVALTVLAPVALGGCGFARRERLLVWHDWPDPEAAVLTELLSSYGDLDPDLDLIVEYVPDDEIESRFAAEVRSGFGPDVLIGVDAGRLAGLAEDGAVHTIRESQIEARDLDLLDPRAMGAMSFGGTQVGVPLVGSTDVLYFREGVAPPRSLEQIVELAEEGRTTAIPLGFFAAYWGVDAFDGSVFGDDGSVSPDDGFVAWMEWLVEARPHPNVILDGEYEMLRDLFAAGEIDVFVGGSRELGHFRTILQDPGVGSASPDVPAEGATEGAAGATGLVPNGSERAATEAPESTAPDSTMPVIDEVTPTLANVGDLDFGLTTLPVGENDEPGGFLEIEGMVVNRHTSSLEGSLDLMEYLTNVPSQGRIARSGVGRIPINDAVSIDPTISPIEAALVDQQRRSVVLPDPFQHHRAELRSVADDVYLQVARGLLDPVAAVAALVTGYETAIEETSG